MTAEIIPFPRRYNGTLSKRQIARELGRSTRWVEIAMRDHGLPFSRDERGYARFDLDAVEAWRSSRNKEARSGAC